MKLFVILTLATLIPILLCSADPSATVKSETQPANKATLSKQDAPLFKPLATLEDEVKQIAEKEVEQVQHMMEHIDDLRKEISSTIHKMGTELHPHVHLTRRDRLMFDHVLEALRQAEHASLHALDKAVHSASPLVGPLTRATAYNDLSSTALRYIGMFGLAMIFGNMIHYLMWGFFATGTLLVMFASTVPLLFSSIMMFPSVLLFLEGLLGLSYLSALFSYWGISQLLLQFDNIMHSSALLELVGVLTTIAGISILQL
jgi:hypothetical protein